LLKILKYLDPNVDESMFTIFHMIHMDVLVNIFLKIYPDDVKLQKYQESNKQTIYSHYKISLYLIELLKILE